MSFTCDVYYAGTPREVQRNFLDVWRAYGPRTLATGRSTRTTTWTAAGGYFQHLLPAIGQPASYFNAANRYWQIVGLDSAYVNDHISTEQWSWLGAQLVGGARTILLTHHHLLSPLRKRGDALEKALDSHLHAVSTPGFGDTNTTCLNSQTTAA